MAIITNIWQNMEHFSNNSDFIIRNVIGIIIIVIISLMACQPPAVYYKIDDARFDIPNDSAFIYSGIIDGLLIRVACWTKMPASIRADLYITNSIYDDIVYDVSQLGIINTEMHYRTINIWIDNQRLKSFGRSCLIRKGQNIHILYQAKSDNESNKQPGELSFSIGSFIQSGYNKNITVGNVHFILSGRRL